MKQFIVLAVALLIIPMAFAQTYIFDDGDVEQWAQIGGGQSPPEVEYVWVLPDEDPFDPETQVHPNLSSERNDIYACIVMSDPQGRDDVQQVFADVFHPPNTLDILPCVDHAGQLCDDSSDLHPLRKDQDLFKYQVHAERLDVVDDRQEIEDCKADALEAGLINQADFDEINYQIFSQPNWYMYKVYLPMLYHQPAGEYHVWAWGTDTASSVSGMEEAHLHWVPTVALEIDFGDGLDYGVLQPSVFKVIQGDYDMSSSEAPTVKNEGNVLIDLCIESTTLVGDQFEKEIDDFDVKWDPKEIGFGYGYQEYGPDEKIHLGDPLELCQTEKIDFSVHADVGLPQDDYHGTLTIYVGELGKK